MSQPAKSRPWPLYIGGTVALLALALPVALQTQGKAEAQIREQRQREVAAGPTVLVKPAAVQAGTDTVTLTADVKPFRRASIFAKFDGYLRNLRVDRGDEVRAGQTLGFIEAPDAEYQLVSAEASRAPKQEIAARTRELKRLGLVSQQDLDLAERDLKVAEIDVKRLKALRGYELLRAPFAGVVVARNYDTGALVSSLVTTADGTMPVLEIWDPTQVRLQVNVGRDEAPLIKVGDVAQVWTAERPQEVRSARVTRTTGVFDPRTQTMMVELLLDNRDRHWSPGSFAQVRFSLRAPAGVKIPIEAVTVRKGEMTVAVVQDGRASYRVVQLGRTDGRNVRVLTGVRAGELVALYPSDDIVAEGKVRQVLVEEK
jgi:membrane fusion protein, multidrug efflux system